MAAGPRKVAQGLRVNVDKILHSIKSLQFHLRHAPAVDYMEPSGEVMAVMRMVDEAALKLEDVAQHLREIQTQSPEGTVEELQGLVSGDDDREEVDE